MMTMGFYILIAAVDTILLAMDNMEDVPDSYKLAMSPYFIPKFWNKFKYKF